jgi:hypothetical protein
MRRTFGDRLSTNARAGGSGRATVTSLNPEIRQSTIACRAFVLHSKVRERDAIVKKYLGKYEFALATALQRATTGPSTIRLEFRAGGGRTLDQHKRKRSTDSIFLQAELVPPAETLCPPCGFQAGVRIECGLFRKRS